MPLEFESPDPSSEQNQNKAVGNIVIESPVLCPECREVMSTFLQKQRIENSTRKLIIMCAKCKIGFRVALPEKPPDLFRMIAKDDGSDS